MSESKLNKLASPGYQTFKQSMIKPTSFFSILLVAIGIVSSSHSAIASTSLVTEQAVRPDSTLHAQMNNGSNGRMYKSKMYKKKYSKKYNNMGRSKKYNNMGRSKKYNNMGRSKMYNNMGRSMDSSKK